MPTNNPRVTEAVDHITAAATDACNQLANAYQADLDALQAEYDAYKAAHPDTEPEPPDPTPPGPDPDKTVIGMSSPADLWNQRLSEVGKDGIKARRIFAQLNSAGSDQMNLVTDAHNAGMVPVFSFKVPSVSSAKKGSYDSWVRNMVDKLDAFGKLTTVTFWHEPHGDMTPADFVDVSERYLPILQDSNNLKVGPFLNGWLLDKRVADFTSYTSERLLSDWDFMGIDTYEEGDMPGPGKVLPGDRVPKLIAWLENQGHPGKPTGYGEYNGYSANSINKAGEAFLASPNTWFACMWNATKGKGYALEGERLQAFKDTKADARVVK